MGLNLAEKAIFTKRIDVPMIRYKNANILIRCIRISQNLIFFLQLPFLNDFITLFFSFFSALLLSLPFAFHILSGCREKLSVKFETKQGNGTVMNYRYNGLHVFFHNFYAKTGTNDVFPFSTLQCL